MFKVTRKCKLHHLQKYCNALKLRYLIGQNHDAISKQQSLYKVHFGKLSDHLYDSVNRDLKSVSMVRLDDKPSLDH